MHNESSSLAEHIGEEKDEKENKVRRWATLPNYGIILIIPLMLCIFPLINIILKKNRFLKLRSIFPRYGRLCLLRSARSGKKRVTRTDLDTMWRS
jgi:hypothetical protein